MADSTAKPAVLGKFAERLRGLRKAQNLSQAQAAELLDTGLSRYQMWEQALRLPPGLKLLEVAEFFGVSLDYLLEQ